MRAWQRSLGALVPCILLAGAACGGAVSKSGAQGDTYDSIKRLPDWSGNWTLSDESFRLVQQTSDSPDPNNPNVPKLTQKYWDYRMINKVQNRGLDGKGAQNNAALCIPDGMPGIMSIPMGHEYLVTPGRVTIIAENGEVRRIFTDGRPHPEDPDLKFAGHSTGYWENGSTLVVDTVAILPKAEFFVGLPGAPGTHVSERIHKNKDGQMQIDTVVTNPTVFREPFKYTRKFDHNPIMEEALCMENNRDNNGVIDMTPPGSGPL
jgi:hypothetical protein